MKNILLEEIERYKILSNYNTKLTLTENVDILLEAPAINYIATVDDVAKMFGKKIELVMKDLNLRGISKSRLTTLMELDAEKFANEMNKAIAKDAKTVLNGQVGPLAKELGKVDYLKRLTSEVTNINKSRIEAQQAVLTADEIATKAALIAKDAKADVALAAKSYAPKAPRTPKKPTEPVKPNPSELDDAAKAVTEKPEIKTWDWKKLRNWAIGTTLTAGALYAIYKMGHKDEPPVVTDDGSKTQPNPDPNPNPKPTTSKYTPCPPNDYKRGCKSDVVRQVQVCLGMPPKYQTGNFGPITQGELKKLGKGFENGFTDADKDTICNKQPQVVVTPGEASVDDANNA